MNLNNVSPISCKANTSKFAKQFNIPMKDGSETIMKLTDNTIECLTHNKGRIVGGYGHKFSNGNFTNVTNEACNIYKKSLANSVKEGFDFLKEFLIAISK